ncbi:hypothetical protein OQA88_1273 [Cercophora sp. LCS_1]
MRPTSLFLFAHLATARVRYMGVSIAGGDFGCTINGTCPPPQTLLPTTTGPDQMTHFATTNMLNIFRLPVSWQHLVASTLSGPLIDNTPYYGLLDACLATGATCILCIHNFARWDGAVIGQSQPPTEVSTADFVSLWRQLAARYAATTERLMFELMNEPHDLDMAQWAETLQAVVAAIRAEGFAGTILLPGTGFSSAGAFLSSGSADALSKIKNPDGGVEGLVFALHKYLDADNSGTGAECVTNNTAAFGEVADFLRREGRMGLVSETGAPSDGGNGGCLVRFCEQNAYVNANPDVFLGLVGWGAGSFGEEYLLSMTPRREGSVWVDKPVLRDCIVGTWMGSTAGVTNLLEIETTEVEEGGGISTNTTSEAATEEGKKDASGRLTASVWVLAACLLAGFVL